MRFLPPALVLAFCWAGALRATDFPTIKTPLPDHVIPQAQAITPIDLRQHFEVTGITQQVVQFRTNLGDYNIELRPDVVAATVQNFLVYVNGGRFANTIVHRSDKGLGVIQGGGYKLPIPLNRITTDAPIALQYNLPNQRGTIAMARTDQLNSATSEWFINTDDNSVDLGQSNGGGYAVFGRVTGSGMSVVDAIAALPAYNAGSPFGQLPLTGYTGGNLQESHLVTVTSAQAIPVFPTSAGQTAVVSFQVSNSNPTLATVALVGSTLTVTPVAGQFGATDVTVTATDTNGNFVQDSFRVKVGVPEINIEQPGGAVLLDNGSYGFPLVNVGSSADAVFTVRNPGTTFLDLTGNPRVELQGTPTGQFTVTQLPATIASNGSSTFTVRFIPTAGGLKTATLRILSDDSDEGSFDFTVSGTANARPTLTLPSSPVIEEATSPNGAAVTFAVSASDAEDGAITPATPPWSSGDTFPVGDTTVTVTATDNNNAQTTSTFVVRVRDTTDPLIGGTFSPLALGSDRTGKAIVPNYVPQATTSDLVGVTNVTQEPAAGSLLADGTANVTLTAHDAAGNTATTTFAISVSPGTTVLLAKTAPVPGAGIDPDIPSTAKWGAFGLPSLTMNGGVPHVGWLSTVSVSAKSSFSGIFSGPVGAPALRLKTTKPITDADGVEVANVKFASFRTPVFAGGDFAVLATVKGSRVVPLVNDTGLWVKAGSTLYGVARTGTTAPGAGTTKFRSISSVVMPTPGTVFFTGKLNTAALDKDTALWRWNSTDRTQLVLREGAMIDLGSGPVKLKSFVALSSVPGSPGHARYDTSVPAIDVLLTLATSATATTTAIATVTADGALHLTKSAGTNDGAGRTLKAIGIPSSPGADLAATALVTYVPSTALDLPVAKCRAIFDFEADSIVAQTGVTAPGAGTAKFFALQNPATGFGAGGQRTTVFGATLSGTTVARDKGLWAHTAAGGLSLLAREGSVPPGAPGTKWLSFPSFSVLDGVGPMFIGKLMQVIPSVTTANDTGFWVTNSAGQLQLLLRTGDRIGGKKVLSFALLGAVAGSPGQRRAWVEDDTATRVIYRVSFTDGSTVIMNSVIP